MSKNASEAVKLTENSIVQPNKNTVNARKINPVKISKQNSAVTTGKSKYSEPTQVFGKLPYKIAPWHLAGYSLLLVGFISIISLFFFYITLIVGISFMWAGYIVLNFNYLGEWQKITGVAVILMLLPFLLFLFPYFIPSFLSQLAQIWLVIGICALVSAIVFTILVLIAGPVYHSYNYTDLPQPQKDAALKAIIKKLKNIGIAVTVVSLLISVVGIMFFTSLSILLDPIGTLAIAFFINALILFFTGADILTATMLLYIFTKK